MYEYLMSLDAAAREIAGGADDEALVLEKYGIYDTKLSESEKEFLSILIKDYKDI